MTKKALLRVFLAAAIVCIGVVGLTSIRMHNKMAGSLQQTPSLEDGRKAAGEFMIWETLTRTIMSSTNF